MMSKSCFAKWPIWTPIRDPNTSRTTGSKVTLAAKWSRLRFDLGSSDHLETVVGATVDQFLDSTLDRVCGPYELLKLLGEGGMDPSTSPSAKMARWICRLR